MTPLTMPAYPMPVERLAECGRRRQAASLRWRFSLCMAELMGCFQVFGIPTCPRYCGPKGVVLYARGESAPMPLGNAVAHAQMFNGVVVPPNLEEK